MKKRKSSTGFDEIMNYHQITLSSEVNQLLEVTIFNRSQLIAQDEGCVLRYYPFESGVSQAEDIYFFKNVDYNNFIVKIIDLHNLPIDKYFDSNKSELWKLLNFISNQMVNIKLVGTYIKKDYKQCYTGNSNQAFIEYSTFPNSKPVPVDETYIGIFRKRKDAVAHIKQSIIDMLPIIDKIFRLLYIAYEKVDIKYIYQAMPLLISLTNTSNTYKIIIQRTKGGESQLKNNVTYKQQHLQHMEDKVHKLIKDGLDDRIILKEILRWEYATPCYKKIIACRKSRSKEVGTIDDRFKKYYESNIEKQSPRYRKIRKFIKNIRIANNDVEQLENARKEFLIN
ncbi:MAG: hypothetical protein K0R94_563 [Burkholderiales bacterium]|jgi:hypothetical protein|nr:hypothetical protein [Burkholderiales bacterium]